MTVREYLDLLPARSALVLGDICLDRWCTYDPAAAEPSRETGLTRLAVVHTEVTPGAGGTIANNLAALGVGRVNLLGVVGDDGHGHELMNTLSRRGISRELILHVPGRPTFAYTKLINKDTGIEDQPRVDFVSQQPLPEALEDRILTHIRDFAGAFDVVFVSDQAETGQAALVTPRVRELLAELSAAGAHQVYWVDSRQRVHEFRGVVLKPNQQEADAACRHLFGRVDYAALRAHTRARCLIVTLGEQGALAVDEAGERMVPSAHVRTPVDVCGAGDSFSAAAGMAFALSGSAELAARMGNLAAAITVMQKGTGAATRAAMLELGEEGA